jgi:hypothetical protein
VCIGSFLFDILLLFLRLLASFVASVLIILLLRFVMLMLVLFWLFRIHKLIVFVILRWGGVVALGS